MLYTKIIIQRDFSFDSVFCSSVFVNSQIICPSDTPITPFAEPNKAIGNK